MGSELDLTTSVIVATKDRFENVLSCLESVMKQSVLPETFIVVDASEKDGLQTQLKNKLADSSIELIYIKAEPGLTRQRNLGIKANRNELVLFLDDDVVLDKKYLEQMKRIFSEDKKRKIGGATGFITNTSDYNKFSKFIRKLFCLAEIKKGEVKKSWANCGVASEIKEKTEVQWLSGCNQMYRAEVFRKNLFDESLKGYCYMEDVDFSFRVGKQYKLIYNPRAKCVHNHLTMPTSRLRKKEKQKMFMLNYYYLFRKNLPQKSSYLFCHFWSYFGYLIRGIFLERDFGFFVGTLNGIFVNLSGKNPLVNNLKKDNKRETEKQ